MTIHISAESAMALALALNNPACAMQVRRQAAADAIEELIAFLDETEGDCDLEPAGDERDCSWAEQFTGRAVPGGWNEDDEDGADDEPSLAAPEARIYTQGPFWSSVSKECTQTHWASGSRLDGEENVEDEGEATNEDGGDINDEPHDEEQDCCAVDEMGSSYGGMGYEAKQAIDADVRAMLAKVKRKPKEEPSLTIVGPDLRAYRIRIAN